MRRLSALVAAAAILVMLLPATSLAARADRFEVQQVDFECFLETDGGTTSLFVNASADETFVDFAFWEVGAEPFEDAPTLVAASIDIVADATGVSGTLDLVEFDETVDPPFGDPAGIATIDATFTPDGPPSDVDDRFRQGNRWEKVSGTVQALIPSGELALPNGDTADLSSCFAQEADLDIFLTNPSAFVQRFDEFFASCTWFDEEAETVVGLFAAMDPFGAFSSVFVSTPDGDLDGSGETTFTTTELAVDTELFDIDTGDPAGSASGSATLAATGERLRLVGVSAAEVTKTFAEPYSIDGTLEVTLGSVTAEYPMDDEHCTVADQRGILRAVVPGGPAPRPLANDTPEDAKPLALGRRDRVVSGANDPEPEVPCTFEDPNEPEPIDVPFGFTVWYTVQGTGGDLTVDTAGSLIDTVVGVYAEGPSGLEQIGCVDDVFEPSFSLSAHLTWPSEAGVTYFIQVGGFGGGSGRLETTVQAS